MMEVDLVGIWPIIPYLDEISGAITLHRCLATVINDTSTVIIHNGAEQQNIVVLYSEPVLVIMMLIIHITV